MTRADVVRALNEEYARLRDENLRRRDQRIDEVIAADPAMEPLVHGGAALFQLPEERRGRLFGPGRVQRGEEGAAVRLKGGKAGGIVVVIKLRQVGAGGENARGNVHKKCLPERKLLRRGGRKSA